MNAPRKRNEHLTLPPNRQKGNKPPSELPNFDDLDGTKIFPAPSNSQESFGTETITIWTKILNFLMKVFVAPFSGSGEREVHTQYKDAHNPYDTLGSLDSDNLLDLDDDMNISPPVTKALDKEVTKALDKEDRGLDPDTSPTDNSKP